MFVHLKNNPRIMRSASRFALLFALCTLAVSLASCDLFGSGEQDPGVEGVPPERLVAMVAVWDDGKGGDKPVHRLVVADFENPERYDVLRDAGSEVGGTCFSPDKRRILFADHTGGNVGTRASLKLYDLNDGEVRSLDGAPTAATHDGTLKCIWRADGSGFYYSAGGAAGQEIPVYYDLESKESRSFEAVRFHGLRGRDSLLANVGSLYESETKGPFGFCFIDAQTEKLLECLENEYLRFIPWEDESRGGWKQAAFDLIYGKASGLLAFERRIEDEKYLAVTDLEGESVKTHSTNGVIRNLRWAERETVLFNRYPQPGSSWDTFRIMVWDIGANDVRAFADPEIIDGAVGLHLPDY